ncbi:hypothetical protein RIF23_17690 [Lipingzhangella sp. LS1_29]|uniref:DUF6542 domain-containing protein n=1 Tax=Lipingzhangella rawalii TaxID=2055835 RepID=A0ABU2H9X5_9ACTN|nr:DUF6542 domain-containing protein [Lipingzhangella rawalii]MDS1272125.1 hypothetical protein [Lipingzhangella rawalii]
MSRDEPGPAPGPHVVAGPGAYRPLRMTGRGAVLLMIVVCFVSSLTALLLGQPTLGGLGFFGAAIFAVVFVRPADLLTLSVCPPLAYFLGALLAELAHGIGSEHTTGNLLMGLGAQLAHAAPWLFLGTAAVLVIGVFRGLATNIREFSDELNAARLRRRAQSPSDDESEPAAG